jgi:antitoxin component of MazEF toxin-antitoxin module
MRQLVFGLFGLDVPSPGPYYVRTMRRRISTSGNSAAIVLSQDLLGLMGVAVGDEVDLSLIDRTLVIRPLTEAERAAKIQSAVDQVFSQRTELFRRLAEGVTAEDSRPTAKPRRRK